MLPPILGKKERLRNRRRSTEIQNALSDDRNLTCLVQTL